MKVAVISLRSVILLFYLISLNASSIEVMCFLYWSINLSFSLFEAMIFFNLNLSKGWVSIISGLPDEEGAKISVLLILLEEMSAEFTFLRYSFSKSWNFWMVYVLSCALMFFILTTYCLSYFTFYFFLLSESIF